MAVAACAIVGFRSKRAAHRVVKSHAFHRGRRRGGLGSSRQRLAHERPTNVRTPSARRDERFKKLRI